MPYCSICAYDILDGEAFVTIEGASGSAVDRHGVPYIYTAPDTHYHVGRSADMCNYQYNLSLEVAS